MYQKAGQKLHMVFIRLFQWLVLFKNSCILFQSSGHTLCSPGKMNHCAAFLALYPEIAFKCVLIHVCVLRQGYIIHTLTCTKISPGAKMSAVSVQQGFHIYAQGEGGLCGRDVLLQQKHLTKFHDTKMA